MNKSLSVNILYIDILNAFRFSNFFDKYLILLFIFSGSVVQRGLWPPRPRGFLITHNDAPQSIGLLWTNDQLVAETST
jgi:hypothetical protein